MIFPNIARQYCADLLFHKMTFNRDLYLALFKTNYIVTSAMTLASVQECDFSGYSRVQLAQTSSWLKGPIDSDGMYPWILPTPVSFVCNGGGITNNVYGVMLLCTQQDTLQIGPPTLYLVGADNIPNYPVNMSRAGATINAQPIVRLGQCHSS